jgi:hypothetical protein
MGQYQKLFITGCPKSGTTWLVRALDGHPQIVASGEGRFAWRLFPYLQQAALEFNKDQRSFRGSEHSVVSDGELHLVMRSFSENILLRYLAASKKPHENVKVIGDKTPQHVMAVSLLHAVYPTGRFINIVRDPRDVATSALFHLGKHDPRPKDEFVEGFITQSWKAHIEAAIAAEKSLGASTFLNIRYEDFHSDEPGVLRKCLNHLGVDSSDEMVSLCSQAGSFEKLSGGRKRGETDSTSFYRSGMVGDWKNHLDPAVVQRACAKIEGLMAHFGYSTESKLEATIYVASPSKAAA